MGLVIIVKRIPDIEIFRADANLRPCQTSMKKLFAKIMNGFYSLVISAKSSIIDVFLKGS